MGAFNGIVVNAERDRIVDYADSYSSARQYVFVRADAWCRCGG